MIGAAITAVPGSSNWFKGGIIAYENTIKKSLLDVPEKVLNIYGAVSEEAVFVMAKTATEKLNTDCSIAISGIAGPDGGSKDKPLGLVFIGICFKEDVKVFKHVFSGTRSEVREQAVLKSLQYLMEIVSAKR
jgi:PncC family amidohydrolase